MDPELQELARYLSEDFLPEQADGGLWKGKNRTIMNTDTHRVSWGSSCPWQSHTERKVRRPGALSVAGSRGTPRITGVACGAETRHSERRADPTGVSGNAGARGRSSEVHK